MIFRTSNESYMFVNLGRVGAGLIKADVKVLRVSYKTQE